MQTCNIHMHTGQAMLSSRRINRITKKKEVCQSYNSNLHKWINKPMDTLLHRAWYGSDYLLYIGFRNQITIGYTGQEFSRFFVLNSHSEKWPGISGSKYKRLSFSQAWRKLAYFAPRKSLCTQSSAFFLTSVFSWFMSFMTRSLALRSATTIRPHGWYWRNCERS